MKIFVKKLLFLIVNDYFIKKKNNFKKNSVVCVKNVNDKLLIKVNFLIM